MDTPEEAIFLATDFYQKSLETKEVDSDYVTWNGETYLYIYSPIGKSGISLCSLIPQKNIVAEVSTIRNLTILIVVIAAVIAILLGNHLAGGLSKTVKILSNRLEKIAEGDLTQPVDIKRSDEFGALGSVLNSTIENIRQLMTNMKQFGGNVTRMADDISEQTDAFNDSIQNVSIGIDDVAQGLQAQAEETQNIVTEQGAALNETITVFGVIEEKVSELVNGLQTIVDGMSQINTDKDVLQSSVKNISMAAETAVASIEEVTATLDEQVGVIAGLAENTDRMKKETSVLEESMNQFKI